MGGLGGPFSPELESLPNFSLLTVKSEEAGQFESPLKLSLCLSSPMYAYK